MLLIYSHKNTKDVCKSSGAYLGRWGGGGGGGRKVNLNPIQGVLLEYFLNDQVR